MVSLALFGNAMYILWILYNAIDERGQGISTVQAIVLIGLVFLLALNSIILFKKKLVK